MADVFEPGGEWLPGRSSPELRWGLKQYLVCIHLAIHTNYMSKQCKTIEKSGGCSVISDEVVPLNVKDPQEQQQKLHKHDNNIYINITVA